MKQKSEKFLNAKITKRSHAFKGYVGSYNVEILNTFNPELQIKDTKSAIKNEIIYLLTELKGFKFVTTLVLELKNIERDDKTKYNTFYSNSKAVKIINESDIDDVFESIYTTIKSNMQKSLGKGSGWIIDSVIYHNVNISKYNPLAGSSYTKLQKELNHPRKGLIKFQKINDNKYFKWSLVKYLHPSDHHPAIITKSDKDFSKIFDFKDIKFPVEIIDIHKIEKYPIYVSKKCCEKKNMLIYY